VTTPDPLGVQIGAREIYDKLTDVDRKVTDMGGQVLRLADQHDGLRSDVAEIRLDLADKEGRLRVLERESASRMEVQAVKEAVDAKLAERSRMSLGIATLLVSASAVVSGTGAAIVTLVIQN
jgi:hypothetical protein